jgi:hypothetical protein
MIRRSWVRHVVIFVALIAHPSLSAVAQTLVPSVPRQVSVGLGPAAADGESDEVAVCPNANIIAFKSLASNLVVGDGNEASDVFVRNQKGTITRVSVSPDGTDAFGPSRDPSLSQVEPNGSYGIAFVSEAPNLINPPLEQQQPQVYLRLPHLNKTFLISRGSETSEEAAGIGPSGKPSVVSLDGGKKYLVAFHSQAINLVEGAMPSGLITQPPKRIFIATVIPSTESVTLEVLRAGKTNYPEVEFLDPVLSGTGTKLAFRTNSNDLGWQNPSPEVYQVVLASKLERGKFVLISRSQTDDSPGTDTSEHPSLSFDGSVVAFKTSAPNIGKGSRLAPALVAYNVKKEKFSLINSDENERRGNQSAHPWVKLDPTGRFAVFTDPSDNYLEAGSDTNNRADIFVKDLDTNAIVRINVGADEFGVDVQETDGQSDGASLGTLGYNTLGLSVGFHSSGTLLRRFSRVSDELEREVYQSTITFKAPPLENNAPISTPPDVFPGNRKLTLRLRKFLIPSSVTALDDVAALAKKVAYDIRLTKATTKKQRKVTTTKNRITLRNIKPGTYTVKYRVSGKTSSGKRATTRFSPKQTVKVTQR